MHPPLVDEPAHNTHTHIQSLLIQARRSLFSLAASRETLFAARTNATKRTPSWRSILFSWPDEDEDEDDDDDDDDD